MTVFRSLSKADRHLRRVLTSIRRAFRTFPHGVYVAQDAQVAESVLFDMQAGGEVFVGTGCHIEQGAILAPYGGSIRLAARVYVGPYSVLYGHGGLAIGEDSLIATHCVLIPANHIWRSPSKTIASQGEVKRGIVVGRDVWLGAGVRVLDGSTIGDGAIVGAGAVVSGALPQNAIAVGVPARVRGSRQSGDCDLKRARNDHESGA